MYLRLCALASVYLRLCLCAFSCLPACHTRLSRIHSHVRKLFSNGPQQKSATDGLAVPASQGPLPIREVRLDFGAMKFVVVVFEDMCLSACYLLFEVPRQHGRFDGGLNGGRDLVEGECEV